MYKSKSRQSFLDVVPVAITSEVWDDDPVGERDRLEPSPSTRIRNPGCTPGCRVCFLAQEYGLTPREVTLIALICSDKSGRAISQILGIGIADDSSALRQDSWQDWHPFAARNRFMGDTQWDGEKRGST
jgi:hypothetical protein